LLKNYQWELVKLTQVNSKTAVLWELLWELLCTWQLLWELLWELLWQLLWELHNTGDRISEVQVAIDLPEVITS